MFLEAILNNQKIEVASRKKQRPLNDLLSKLAECNPVRPFAASLKGESLSLIAEIKKASPSKGLLCPNFNPAILAKSYETAGVAAISVLTEEKFFQGSLADLKLAKAQTQKTPILRKDFIIDFYQLVEARVWGADAILLIVAALNKDQLKYLLQEAGSLNLTPLVEVHNKPELDLALELGAKVIGINNRDLKTFKVNLENTYQLIKLIPPGITVISESGIKSHTDIMNLATAGVNAVLVGESIVTAIDPESAIRSLLGVVS